MLDDWRSERDGEGESAMEAGAAAYGDNNEPGGRIDRSVEFEMRRDCCHAGSFLGGVGGVRGRAGELGSTGDLEGGGGGIFKLAPNSCVSVP